jgi:hypothetical protein
MTIRRRIDHAAVCDALYAWARDQVASSAS